MPTLTTEDISRMRDQLFYEGPRRSSKVSRFWLLLVLAAVIATAGVASDSTATVIGAMIVAPLMTPILGLVLAIVLADQANVMRSLLFVVAGSVAVIAIAWAIGLVVPLPIVAATSTQVSGRIHPRLIDLMAALATGAVGAVALARSDISDTLPGVAIAISLVPPLAVVGLTLEAGATGEAGGALLLFATNVAAILFSGIVVMAVFRVTRYGAIGRHGVTYRHRAGAITLVVATLVLVAVPLGFSSRAVGTQAVEERRLADATKEWADAAGWRVLEVSKATDGYRVRAASRPPEPDTADLHRRMEQAGVGGAHVLVELVPEQRVEINP